MKKKEVTHHSKKDLVRIRELFQKLKEGYTWLQKNEDQPDECMALIGRAEPIIKELEGLDVGRDFSQVLLILGGKIDWKKVK